MPEQRSARNVRSPLVVALEAAIREAIERRDAEGAERAQRRATMRVVEGGARRDAA